MSALRKAMLVAVIPAIGVLACAGDDPANNAGFVQISAVSVAPSTIGCGASPSNPPKIIAAPDTLLVQVQMVNTTANDVSVTTAGTFGVIMVSNDPADVGESTANFSSVPFNPSPALLAARYGDLTIRVSVPMEPVCESKPLGHFGDQDINISARMSTTSGQYVTGWQPIKVTWR